MFKVLVEAILEKGCDSYIQILVSALAGLQEEIIGAFSVRIV